MAYSRQDLITLALENLGVLAAGQEASLEDRAAVDRRIDGKLAELAKREIIGGLNAESLDDAVFLFVGDVIAYACRFSFGINGAKAEGLTAANADAEAKLKDLSRQYSTTASTAAFDIVRHVLETLGVVTAGQDPSAQDIGVVRARVAPMITDLRARKAVAFLTLDAAETAHLPHLATVLTARCAPAFGVAGEGLALLAAAAEQAESRLRAMVRQYDAGIGTDGSLDVLQSVIETLGIVEAGQSATPKDRAVINARVPTILADLRRREICTVQTLDGADSATLPHLITIIAARTAPLFFSEPARLQALNVEGLRAESDLRRIARQLDTGIGTAGSFDLIQHVLEMLGVVAGGQTASFKDRVVVSARIPVLLADLRRREVIRLASVTGLDDGVLLQLATLLAYRCARQFEADEPMLVALRAEQAEAEAALRLMARQIDDGAGTAGVFDLFQHVLEALGVVAAGQTASFKDRLVVQSRVEPMLADLRRREIVALPSVTAADAATQLHLAAILTLACAGPFKIVGEALLPFQAAANGAEAALRLIGRQLDGGVATSGTFDPIQAVLENLGVVLAGYTGSDKDRAVVSARVADTLADLRLREVASIASLETAPAGTAIHLSVILTSACAQAFGKDAATRALLAGEALKAEASLKALARQLDTGVAVSTVFDPVQVALEHLGIVSAGQTASAADRAVVEARVQPLLLELHGRDICGVTDLSALSTELQRAFTRLLAADCSLSFSEVAPARIALLQGWVPEAERSLRYQSFVYDARPPLRLEPFWGRRRAGVWGGGEANFAPAAAPPEQPQTGTLTVIVDGGRAGAPTSPPPPADTTVIVDGGRI